MGEYVIAAIAISAIAYMEVEALKQGINGKVFRVSVGAICLISGIGVGTALNIIG